MTFWAGQKGRLAAGLHVQQEQDAAQEQVLQMTTDDSAVLGWYIVHQVPLTMSKKHIGFLNDHSCCSEPPASVSHGNGPGSPDLPDNIGCQI